MTCGTTSVINTPTDQRRTFLQGEPKERGVEMHEKGLKVVKRATMSEWPKLQGVGLR